MMPQETATFIHSHPLAGFGSKAHRPKEKPNLISSRLFSRLRRSKDLSPERTPQERDNVHAFGAEVWNLI
jgi:hypothetical protein